MTEKTRRTIGGTALAIGLAVLYLILILSALHSVGTDDALYYSLQTKAGILPQAGISDEDLRRLDAELASYLAGRPNELTLPLESEPDGYSVLAMVVDGALRPAFGEREMTHLEDCRRLFALLRKVHRRLIPWAVLLIVGGAYLLRDRRRARGIALLSPLILLVPVGGFALWAAFDFDGAFTFFHRVLFDNDLWLLDPRTELLIRICPESMFSAMGLRILCISLGAMLGTVALAVLASFLWPKTKQNEGNKWNDNRATRRGAAQRQKTFDFGGKR